jgi:hypothetical protein
MALALATSFQPPLRPLNKLMSVRHFYPTALEASSRTLIPFIELANLSAFAVIMCHPSERVRESRMEMANDLRPSIALAWMMILCANYEHVTTSAYGIAAKVAALVQMAHMISSWKSRGQYRFSTLPSAPSLKRLRRLIDGFRILNLSAFLMSATLPINGEAFVLSNIRSLFRGKVNIWKGPKIMVLLAFVGTAVGIADLLGMVYLSLARSLSPLFSRWRMKHRDWDSGLGVGQLLFDPSDVDVPLKQNDAWKRVVVARSTAAVAAERMNSGRAPGDDPVLENFREKLRSGMAGVAAAKRGQPINAAGELDYESRLNWAASCNQVLAENNEPPFLGRHLAAERWAEAGNCPWLIEPDSGPVDRNGTVEAPYDVDAETDTLDPADLGLDVTVVMDEADLEDIEPSDPTIKVFSGSV